MSFITWILIAVVIAVLFFILKFKEVRHKSGFIIVTLLILFLIISVWQLYSSKNLDFSSYDGIINAGRVYFGWLGGMVNNIVKISGYTTGLDWGISSSHITNITSSIT